MLFWLSTNNIITPPSWSFFGLPPYHCKQGFPSSVQDWSPHMKFILKGSRISTLQLKGWFKSKASIQEYRNATTKLILNLCVYNMVHVSSKMWRIKNRPSYSTSYYSDNALRWLVLMVGIILYWGLQVSTLLCIWGRVLKDCFERGIFWRAKSWLKGIGDFNLELWHWSLPARPRLSRGLCPT